MDISRVDVATSTTDDTRGRPLCLFYFTHPFGVLSPDPPTVTEAPLNIARAFINMEPVPSFMWSPSATETSYKTTSTSNTDYDLAAKTSKIAYELGNSSISRKPSKVIRYDVKPDKDSTNHRKNTSLPLYKYFWKRDSFSSSYPSPNDPMWSISSDCSRRNSLVRKKLPFPYHQVLPPIEVPKFSDESSSDWPNVREYQKFSLPPIELPKKLDAISNNTSCSERINLKINEVHRKNEFRGVNLERSVKKIRRRPKKSSVRGKITAMLRRAIKGGDRKSQVSPAIQEVLHTIREAWASPKYLIDRCSSLVKESSATSSSKLTMPRQQKLLDTLPSTPGASPGLLRRRYSVPETIMRKYRLAQLQSDPEETGPATGPSRPESPVSSQPPRGSCTSLCDLPPRSFRRDREVMRKSAMMRRFWARSTCPACCCCCNEMYDSHGTRSLDGSRSELRPTSSSQNSKASRDIQIPSGWATPKRQRLQSPNQHGSDEMLRIAMRNSYEKSEENRHDREMRNEESSISTYQSHDRLISSCMSSISNNNHIQTDMSSDFKSLKDKRSFISFEPQSESKSEMNLNTPEHSESRPLSQNSYESSLTTTGSTYDTTTIKTTKIDAVSEKKNKYSKVNLNIEESAYLTESNENNEALDNSIGQSYEVLEIVVSETLQSKALDNDDLTKTDSKASLNTISTKAIRKESQGKELNIDEYVSNILIESLNSLTDQIEDLNSNMGSSRKISIVEKEIKVKLQNTGMNTIVHLSPTSNNAIIFGNEELGHKNDIKLIEFTEADIKSRDSIATLESENNNNNSQNEIQNLMHENYVDDPNHNQEYHNRENSLYREENFNVAHYENINQAVLHQIQKLFQEGLSSFNNETNYSGKMVPDISHIEICDTNVYVDENLDSQVEISDTIDIETDRNSNAEDIARIIEQQESLLGKVGTGTYFNDTPDPVLVPRFSALPNTESMEVNTSSSDDSEIVQSECASLVDSLDDPNSPRSLLVRKTLNGRRSELVRSAIDVLDLLPDTSEKMKHQKEKSEAFFIRIRDNDCDCEKENIVVADHMPDEIRERLYRRHKKRELRMEYARRKKIRQMKREIEKQRRADITKSKKEIEKDCNGIINLFIDEVIGKIAEEEYKYMRIKQKPSTKSHETKHRSSKNIKSINLGTTKRSQINLNVKETNCEESCKNKINDMTEVHGKFSVQAYSPEASNNFNPKRIYQKSEIHDGSKCIEILEILEYTDSTQNSPESNTSDETLKKNYKSRIPIPIFEKIHKNPKVKSLNKCEKKLSGRISPIFMCSKNIDKPKKVDKMIVDMLKTTMSDDEDKDINYQNLSKRRASIPELSKRQSNHNRFKQVFEIIPEEKSSLSVESSHEDLTYTRKFSMPPFSSNYDANSIVNPIDYELKKSSQSKSVATSPLTDGTNIHEKIVETRSTSTSPVKKTVSAATSPIPTKNKIEINIEKTISSTGKKSLASHGTRAGWVGFYKPNKKVLEEEGFNDIDKNSIIVGKEKTKTVNTIIVESADPIIVGQDKRLKKDQAVDKHIRNEAKRKKHEKSNCKVDIYERYKEREARAEESLVRSLSDPLSTGNAIVRRDKRKEKIKMVSVEDRISNDSRNRPLKLPNPFGKENVHVDTSDSDTDSGKSLLCALAPKWLGINSRQKRAIKKKNSQDQQSQSSAGGWSVTVAGNCYTAQPADVEMRLSFPKTQAANSQSDSGFDDAKVRPPIAAKTSDDVRHRRTLATLCGCHHCEDCTCSSRKRLEQEDSFLPPTTQSRKMTLTMKRESLGSSILSKKNKKKSMGSLPDLDTFRTSRSQKKSSVKTPRLSLRYWQPREDTLVQPRSDDMAVLGCAIIPETKPRVPTMSERDLTRVYTPREYVRF